MNRIVLANTLAEELLVTASTQAATSTSIYPSTRDTLGLTYALETSSSEAAPQTQDARIEDGSPKSQSNGSPNAQEKKT